MNRYKGAFVISLAVLTLALGTLVAIWYMRRPAYSYSDSFARNDAAEWVSLGGAWQISNGTVINHSDENGAKLVTGSNKWKDYELDADLKLIGHGGNVGVMVRVSDEEVGVDSYNGYYVGLRAGDSALVMGRADHGWMGGRPTAMPGGVEAGVWYRLRVVVVGCQIGAEATNLSTGQSSSAVFEEHRCVPAGKIGLRSMATGGAWRNVHVQRATYTQLAAIRSHAPFLETPIYPIREDDYSRMRELYLHSIPEQSYRTADATGVANVPLNALHSIASAKVSPSPGSSLILRGVVTLTSPLYIQDNTGGITVQPASPVALNLGDEVQVVGTLDTADASAHFVAHEVHLLGDRTPVAPVSVTSTQAANGTFDGRLVELRGILRAKSNAGDEVALQMDDAEQNFRAVGHGSLSQRLYKSWEPGSELRIRGICSVGPMKQPGGGAFTILLRSMDDVQVLSGPPWYSPRLMVRYILLFLCLVALIVYLYLRMEHRKMHAILNERERLAHEMHDTLAQSFAGVSFHLQGMRNSLRSGSLDLHTVMEKLDVACAMVTHTHREASAEIVALHPDSGNGNDLLTTLERSTHAMLENDLLPFTLLREGQPHAFSFTVRDALFHIGREAIANILRHSRATEIVLKLRYEPRQIVLEICDNGCGFCYADHAEDFGIRAMRRRSQAICATLHIDTIPEKGTTVQVQAPYGLHLGLSGWIRSHTHSVHN